MVRIEIYSISAFLYVNIFMWLQDVIFQQLKKDLKGISSQQGIYITSLSIYQVLPIVAHECDVQPWPVNPGPVRKPDLMLVDIVHPVYNTKIVTKN